MVVWNEPKVWDDQAHGAAPAAAQTIELRFPRARRAVAVYRPVSGPDPVTRAADTRSVSLTLTDGPIIVIFD